MTERPKKERNKSIKRIERKSERTLKLAEYGERNVDENKRAGKR